MPSIPPSPEAFVTIPAQWMEANSLTVFSATTAERYCDLHIGSHILTDGMGLKAKQHLRAVCMLVSYQKDGEFEFRSPRREFCFSGQTGGLMLECCFNRVFLSAYFRHA